MSFMETPIAALVTTMTTLLIAAALSLGVAGPPLGTSRGKLVGALFTPRAAVHMAAESFIDKLALVLVKDRKQLVVRSKGKAAFFTPGGKREAGESDEAALIRECKEELTVDLKADTIKAYGVFQAQAFGKPEGTMVRMTCYSALFDGELQASQEIEELRWVDSSVSPELLSVTGVMILNDLKAKNLID